jgi:hypothetical protein
MYRLTGKLIKRPVTLRCDKQILTEWWGEGDVLPFLIKLKLKNSFLNTMLLNILHNVHFSCNQPLYLADKCITIYIIYCIYNRVYIRFLKNKVNNFQRYR